MTTFTARVVGRSSGRRCRLALPLVLVALSGLAVGGCEEGDATVAALERARLALNDISLPAQPVGQWDAGASDPAEAALTRVVADLRPITTQGSTGQKAAASLLMAQAQLGIADRRAAYAALAEREALDALTPIRMKIDAMLSAASGSAALAAYDPAAEIEQLEGLIRSKDAEIAQRQRDRAQIEADILLLRQGAEERLTMAAGQRDEAARLAVAAMAMSAHDAGVQMEQIHTLRRQADAIELDGANLLARAEVRQPELKERELMVGQVVSQKAELVAALAATRAGANESEAEASEHATAAAGIAAEINALVEAALDHRKDVADARINAAIESYEAARSAAGAAAADGYGLVGTAAQGRGDMLWLRAQNLQHAADLLEQLGSFEVPAALNEDDQRALSGTLATYVQRAQTLRAAQRQALADAAEAFEQARDSFERVRGSDEAARVRVNRLTQLLDLCRRGANGRAIDLSTITDEAATFSDDEQPAGEEPPEGGDGGGAAGVEPTGG